MSRKGLKFLGKITPLFPNMLTHAAEGEGSGESSESQPTPSPTQPSTRDQPPETSSSHATRDSLERTNGNEGDQELSILCTNLSNRALVLESIKDAQVVEISALKSRINMLEKKCKPSISHHRTWLKSVKRLSMKKRFGKKESVSKQGRKKSKPESTLDDSAVFDDQDTDHGMEYMETKEAVDEGRQSGETKEVKLTDDTEVVEDKSSGDKGGRSYLLKKELLLNADFVPIGSKRDEKMIDKMNKKAAGMDEEEVLEEPKSTKVEVKQEGEHQEKIRSETEDERNKEV
ncbi:hypothetical protein Tco_0356905 [Tanacetum coccineum]